MCIDCIKHLPVTATLDTNIFMELWRDQKNAHVTQSLLDLADSKQVDLAVTNRINADIPNSPLADRIRSLRQINVKRIGAVFRLDRSALGSGDMLGSEDFIKVMDSIEHNFDRQGRKKRRPDWRDWDHLHGHYLTGRDVFLTWDNPILEVASELLVSLGLAVMKPEAFLDQLAERANKSDAYPRRI